MKCISEETETYSRPCEKEWIFFQKEDHKNNKKPPYFTNTKHYSVSFWSSFINKSQFNILT